MSAAHPRSFRLSECMRIAAAQHGAIGRIQALEAGMSSSSIHRLAAAGLWLRIYPSVYRLWVPPTKEGQWCQRLAAAALWLGDGSGVSHRAAAVLWELEGVATVPVELSTTCRRRSSRPGVVVHRVAAFEVGELTVRSGIPVTSVARTLTDLATVAGPTELELALESAFRRGQVTRMQLEEALSRTGPTRAGRGVLRRLLDCMPGVPTASALEAMVWRSLLGGGLPRPIRQHEIHDEAGRFVARVDLAYPDARLVIEADGYRFHSGRSEWRRDRARQNELVRLGWTVYRVTWDDATRRREALIADIRELLGG